VRESPPGLVEADQLAHVAIPERLRDGVPLAKLRLWLPMTPATQVAADPLLVALLLRTEATASFERG
jgi:hypothetical protein